MFTYYCPWIVFEDFVFVLVPCRVTFVYFEIGMWYSSLVGNKIILMLTIYEEREYHPSSLKIGMDNLMFLGLSTHENKIHTGDQAG